jgi:hypothetical protein
MTSRKGATLSYRDLSPENIDWKHIILTINQKEDLLVFGPSWKPNRKFPFNTNGLTHPQRRTLSPSLQPLTLIARRPREKPFGLGQN